MGTMTVSSFLHESNVQLSIGGGTVYGFLADVNQGCLFISNARKYNIDRSSNEATYRWKRVELGSVVYPLSSVTDIRAIEREPEDSADSGLYNGFWVDSKLVIERPWWERLLRFGR